MKKTFLDISQTLKNQRLTIAGLKQEALEKEMVEFSRRKTTTALTSAVRHGAYCDVGLIVTSAVRYGAYCDVSCATWGLL